MENTYLSQLTTVEEENDWSERENVEMEQNRMILSNLRQQQFNSNVNNNNTSSSFLALQNSLLQQPSEQINVNSQEEHGSSNSNMNSDGDDYLGNLREEVRKYRCLWDTSCRAFKEIQKKKQAWNLIAKKFKFQGVVINFFFFFFF